VVLCLALLLAGPPTTRAVAPEDPVQAEQARFLMGTLATAAAWAGTAGQADAAASAALDEVARLEGILSTWNPESELSRLNRCLQAGMEMAVSPDLARVLAEALGFAAESGGAFDPTVLPLVELWGFRKDGTVTAPSDSMVQATLNQLGYERVTLVTESAVVRCDGGGVRLDFGGIAKGYALDRAAQVMEECGAVAGRLDLGGEILVFGVEAAANVGIVDPGGSEDPLGTIRLDGAAIATSGQYERFREDGNSRWGHILDPRTGYPSRNLMSVTVVADGALLADAAATACFVLGLEEGLAFLEGLPRCEGLIVHPDEQGRPAISFTSGLR